MTFHYDLKQFVWFFQHPATKADKTPIRKTNATPPLSREDTLGDSVGVEWLVIEVDTISEFVDVSLLCSKPININRNHLNDISH